MVVFGGSSGLALSRRGGLEYGLTDANEFGTGRADDGVAATGAPRLNLATLDADIASAEVRLKRVFIENLSYEAVLTRFDKPGTLFYIDPPYWGCESDYGRNIFGRDDFSKLASLLSSLKGKFILSLNDVPGVRSTFGSFKIEPVKTTYSASAKGVTAANEVLITNF